MKIFGYEMTWFYMEGVREVVSADLIFQQVQEWFT